MGTPARKCRYVSMLEPDASCQCPICENIYEADAVNLRADFERSQKGFVSLFVWALQKLGQEVTKARLYHIMEHEDHMYLFELPFYQRKSANEQSIQSVLLKRLPVHMAELGATATEDGVFRSRPNICYVLAPISFPDSLKTFYGRLHEGDPVQYPAQIESKVSTPRTRATPSSTQRTSIKDRTNSPLPSPSPYRLSFEVNTIASILFSIYKYCSRLAMDQLKIRCWKKRCIAS
eukprot:TRINITY_DN34833_c0_g1_i1.p2 TRINITY_DN34833_c0_g1~~TRINITY_DN34833_c0_g1_i1.p2  ORF type:complete len:234 (+),score=11.57 TRINITY_DN34833_c0_g1_i1:374-1075(+)